jgi:hypothetical protein
MMTGYAGIPSDHEATTGMEIDDDALISRDDDTPGVRVVVPPAGIVTTEAGGQVHFGLEVERALTACAGVATGTSTAKCLRRTLRRLRPGSRNAISI